MSTPVIVVKTEGDQVHATDRRKDDWRNFGFYCPDEDCRQFVALWVPDRDQWTPIELRADPAGSAMSFRCPFCAQVQQVHERDVQWITVTDATRQRPPAGS